jgi:hypothetical protein
LVSVASSTGIRLLEKAVYRISNRTNYPEHAITEVNETDLFTCLESGDVLGLDKDFTAVLECSAFLETGEN